MPYINAVKAKAPISLVDVAMEYGMEEQHVLLLKSGITKANASELEGKSYSSSGTMAEYVFTKV